MISKRDVQLGKVALKAGFVTKDQITKCLALKKKLAKAKGKRVALGSLLIKKGYLTKDQLEECVRIHNEDLGDDDGEKAKRKSRRSRKTKAADDDAEEGSKKKKKETKDKDRKKDKKSEKNKKSSTGDDGGSTATATKKRTSTRTTSKRKSKRVKSSREASRSKRKSKEPEPTSDIGSEVDSAVDTVDPAVFQSAPEDAVDTEHRRVIACPDCGKRYRVRKKQVGKRFNCRRCKYRIKVPKDLFQRPVEVRSAVEVEEFLLESGEHTAAPAADGKAPAKAPKKRKASVSTAAARVATTLDRAKQDQSIASLAKAAQAYKPKPLAPKGKFGVVQIATMAVCLAGIVGLAYGGIQLFIVKPAEEEEAAKQEKVQNELDKWKGQLDDVLVSVKASKEAKDPEAIGAALGQLADARAKKKNLLLGNNQELAVTYEEDLDLKQLVRELLIRKGELLLARGGMAGAHDALMTFEKAVKLGGDEQVHLHLARARILTHRFQLAAQGLESLSTDPARALKGLAWELGGDGQKAVEAYQQIESPLRPVLVGRAQLSVRRWDAALEALEGAQDLKGPHAVAAHLLTALAHEAKDEPKKALESLKRAINRSGNSSIALVARAELLLRLGKPKKALVDAEKAYQLERTSRGLVALGDAHLALYDAGRAMQFYEKAVTHSQEEEEGLITDRFDPLQAPHILDPPHAIDAGLLAHCRVAALLAAQGSGRLNEAEQTLSAGVNRRPFSPYGLAAMVELHMVNDINSGATEQYLDQALKLCRRVGGDKTQLIKNRSTAYALLVSGLYSIRQHRYDEALESLKKVATVDPGLAASANVLIGQAHKGRKDSEAASLARRAFNTSETQQDAAFQAGLAHLKKISKKDVPGLKGFVEGVRAQIALDPHNGQLLVLLARAYVKIAQPPHLRKAMEALKIAVEINPEMELAYRTRGYFELLGPPQLVDTTKAAGDLKKARSLEGDSPKALTLYLLALYHWKDNDADSSRDVLLELKKEHPSYLPTYKKLAEVYRHLGQSKLADEAEKEYERRRRSR